MNLILKKDVLNLGRFGDQVRVAEGYARNYLIPKGLAVPVTPASLKQFAAEKDAHLKKMQVLKDSAEKLRQGLENVKLTFQRKAGEDGKLFGSVTTHDIEEAVKAKGFSGVEKKDIHIAEHIKTVGEFNVSIKLHTDVTASVKVEVVKE